MVDGLVDGLYLGVIYEFRKEREWFGRDNRSKENFCFIFSIWCIISVGGKIVILKEIYRKEIIFSGEFGFKFVFNDRIILIFRNRLGENGCC